MNNKFSTHQRLLMEEIKNTDLEVSRIVPEGSLASFWQRPVYKQLAGSATSFFQTKKPQWFIVVGLRGVGKTTLLAQLCLNPELQQASRFYLSLDKAHLRNLEMTEILDVLEHLLEKSPKNQPVFIFLDEVHLITKWGLGIKILYDRWPNLFVVCTSSSALALNTNPDIARRAHFVRLGPLSLPESIFIQSQSGNQLRFGVVNLQPDLNLGAKIQTALFRSKTASQVYKKLSTLFPEINLYWQGQEAKPYIENYVMGYQTLPRAIEVKQAASLIYGLTQETTINQIRSDIRHTLEKVYTHDLPLIGKFDQSSLDYIPNILLWLANSEKQSLAKMSQRLGINIRTLQNILSALVDSDILLAIPPLGSSGGKIAKPYKYLFGAPAIRQTLHQSADGKLDSLRGSLLEDTIGFYLKQAFGDQPFGGLVEYDSSKESADFIVMPDYTKSRGIPVEVGWSKKNGRQVQKTMSVIKSERYGLVITDCELKLDSENHVVFVPLKIFLLMYPQVA